MGFVHIEIQHFFHDILQKSSRANVYIFSLYFWWSTERGFPFSFTFSPRKVLGQSSRSYQPTEADYKVKIRFEELEKKDI